MNIEPELVQRNCIKLMGSLESSRQEAALAALGVAFYGVSQLLEMKPEDTLRYVKNMVNREGGHPSYTALWNYLEHELR